LPPLKAGDLIAIASAGAYGAAMASTYNARPLAAEVMCRDGAFAVVGRRLTVEDSMARESLPPWLEDAGGTPRRRAETST
jgi:diaminopimelate decarboxylase